MAVKVLGTQYAADAGARARFQREARTAARVSDHPHIATIYDIGEHGEDAFIVMEYFSGGTVADRLRAAGGRRRPRAARDGAALAARGRERHSITPTRPGSSTATSSPRTCCSTASERLAVADFGIARLADDTHMTQTGKLLGTAAYLSPEQALGQPATAASDRYALRRRRLRAADRDAPVRRRAADGPGAPARRGPAAAGQRGGARSCRPRSTRVFARGLAKDPAERPRTAVELVEEIERALAPARTDRARPAG